MPPITVHLDAPIKPADETETSTQAQPQITKTVVTTHNEQVPALPSSVASKYAPAQPAAVAASPAPAPTGYISSIPPPPTKTIPQAQTQQNLNDGPPAPQPGALPAAPNAYQQAPMTAGTPQAAITPAPPQPGAQPMTAAPPHAQAPPPTTTAGILPPPPTTTVNLQSNPYAPPSSITSPYEHGRQAPSAPATTTLNLGPVSHPAEPASLGGYHQNVYAQDLSASQRMTLQEQERRENPLSNTFGTQTSGTTFGLGGNLDGTATVAEAAGNAWSAVKGWATVAGEKLAEGEKEVWKRINKS